MQRRLFPSTEELQKTGEVSLGEREPNLVLTGGKYLNVYTGEFVKSDIWLADRFIAKLTDKKPPKGSRIVDISGKFVVPGFIDGHIHVESSLLDPVNFSRAAINCGVTGIVTDCHEAGVTCGQEGLLAMRQAFQETPLKSFWVTPISLPFLPEIQSTVSSLSTEEALEFLRYPETLGLSEVMGDKFAKLVREGGENEMKVIRQTLIDRKLPEGHLFQTLGDELDALIGLGVSSDHEPRRKSEVVEKITKGLFVMLREGTLASEIQTLAGVIKEEDLPPSRFGLVSDDMLARDMTRQGYMVDKITKAKERGVDTVDALRMVTYNVAKHYRIDNLIGTIKPGSFADLVVVDSPDSLNIEKVFCSGLPSEELDKEYSFRSSYDESLSRRIPRRKLTGKDLSYLPPDFDRETVEIRSISLNQENRFTELNEREISVNRGELKLSEVDEDLLYLLCASRVDNEKVGLGFLEDYGLRDGALAVSIAHDHHGVVALGKRKSDVVKAANWVIEQQGGIAFVKEGQVVAGLPLPLAGLMAIENYAEVRRKIDDIEKVLRDNGATWNEPLFLSFWLGMEVAPYYRITERGLLNTEDYSILDSVIV